MTQEHPHPLLAQLPLTVSPFLSLPTATPLPYSYKPLPSTLPPSVTDPQPTAQSPNTNQSQEQQHLQQQAAYVISPNGGRAAHPDQIIESCHALQAHLQKLQDESREMVRKWQDGIRQRELMEKRRVAPGWLDVEDGGHMLVPERKHTGTTEDTQLGEKMDGMHIQDNRQQHVTRRAGQGDGGEELDRAFGGMDLK
ncbi:hypothetical protein BLS_006618 [Venturia inaequalis]|uniref:Uncharacterized protein n=1 Tax=Venturia inaequalis TaxID=5025 RepID=A0A8H3YNE0_VENIN|nr:hypothetical protein BLS_006618 [Venturia inaequalis]KAE9969630.1 hypothetical protein EG328_006773 [Venturia inaequalis]KAE9979177.1 hypothetical protein EG327_007135 [Venturia inaequalis]RDI84396.1 hypothetical protein Vi05172_g5687 [Venturia inaequalis]